MHVNLVLASTADGAAISARASARATRDVIVGGEQCPPATGSTRLLNRQV
jgi:hypothetical protein